MDVKISKELDHLLLTGKFSCKILGKWEIKSEMEIIQIMDKPDSVSLSNGECNTVDPSAAR